MILSCRMFWSHSQTSPSWELFFNSVLSSFSWILLRSLCPAVYLLSIWSPPSFFWPKFSGPQSAFSLRLHSFFSIPQAPLPSLFPVGSVLSLGIWVWELPLVCCLDLVRRALERQQRPLAFVQVVPLRFGTELELQRKTFSGPWSTSSTDRKVGK